MLTHRQRGHALLLVFMLVGNALLEMVGVGLVPVYIGILVEPERLMRHDIVTQAMGLLGLGRERLTQRTLLYGGSVVLLAVFSFKLVFAPLLAYARARFIQGVVRSQSTRLFDGYMRAPYEFHLGRHSSELIRNSATECTRIGDAVLQPMVALVTQLLVTVAIVVLLVVSIPVAAVAALLIFGLVSLPLVTTLNRRIKKLATSAADGRQRMIRYVQEGIGGVKELRLLGRESFFVTRFGSSLRQVLDLQRFMQVQVVGLPVLMEWLSVLAVLIVVLTLFRAGQPQESVLAMVALFAVAMARLKGAVTGLLGAYAQVRAGMVSVDVVDAELRQLEAIRVGAAALPVSGSDPPSRLSDGIAIEDVWFRYVGRTAWVLRGVNLSIGKGEAVGFVGPSGGGKSSLVDVVLGILPPERGSVMVDGVDITGNLRAWQRNVGYIPQVTYLMDGTIRQNVALGLEERDIDDAAVTRAISAANLDEFLSSLPEGANTVIGERGLRLSGGQRQRIAIARALYNDPDVLVMDEATSALDNLTEKAVMEAVEALKGERTILMIAHRLSTVRNCDRIVLLKEGEIIGTGTYEELANSHQEFQRLAQVR